MTAPRDTTSGHRAGPGWRGLVVAGLLVGLAVILIVLIVRAAAPLSPRRPVQVDLPLPQPTLPDTPRLPDGPIVPPVDRRVAPAPATAPAP